MFPDGARALVVEDDTSWQDILTEILTDAGLSVDIADSYTQAEIQMRSNVHSLAVIDLSLGTDPHNRDGLRVLDGLRLFDPQCKAILLTGFATVELAVSSITEHGAVTCLRKETFQRAEFHALIERILASPHTGKIAQETPHSASQPEHPKKREPLEKPTKPHQEKTSEGLILVVEDDAGWRNIFSELLSDAGYLVHVCNSYGEALGCLRRERYILAVVDLSLAGPWSLRDQVWDDGPIEQKWEGYRLLASTRAGGVPTIVVSGVATPSEIERTYTDQGIFAFLQKQTFDRQTFLRTVQDALIARQSNRELEILTEREREVLELLARGMSNKEIAEALFITTNTVKRHLKAIFEKLEVHTRSAAAAKAISRGVSVERLENRQAASNDQ